MVGLNRDHCDNAQRRDTLLGKILRLEVGVLEVADYSVPPDNPYVGNELAKPEIWAYGLRKPLALQFRPRDGRPIHWRCRPKTCGKEINYQPASSVGGENYGWNAYAGYAHVR